MSHVTVQAVATRRQRKQFLSLPWPLYQNDPNWIPPLQRNQEELLGFRKHPFYDDAESQAFVAFQRGQPCGRILALVYHAHNRRYDERRGFFGFFECVDDQQVAQALLDAACQWLAQRGMNCLRGPMNPSVHYEIGLLVDGFDSPPRFMMTYNPPYYERLLTQYGLEKSQDLYAFWGHIDMLQSLDARLRTTIEQATSRFNVKLRRLDRKRFQQEVRTFLRLYNTASAGMWSFVPLSDRELDHISSSLRYLICPELTSVAEIDGQVVGAAFGLLDYNPRIKQIDGRLFPFGFLRLLCHRRRIKQMRILAAEVLPQYQRWGLGLVLLGRLVPEVLAWGIQECEFSWVMESNLLSRRSLERGGAKRIKTYRIYDYELK